MNEINAIILADSICKGSRITSMVLTVPQIVVKELLRHRMFSFSSSSMRAIPFKKVIQDIKENMFVPLAFQSHHSGMQGTEYLAMEEAKKAKQQWIATGIKACDEAEKLYDLGVTKQICSRIIEPFGYARILVTATEWENFFELRCPKYETEIGTFRSKKDAWVAYGEGGEYANLPSTDLEWLQINKSQAEIHIQALAEAMWDAMNESVPKELQPGMWHLPWQDTLDLQQLLNLNFITDVDQTPEGNLLDMMIKASTARCARLSYMTFDGEVDHAKDIELHDRLLKDHHYSPFEHCARAMNSNEYFEFAKGRMLVRDGYGDGDSLEQNIDKDTQGWCNNFRRWIQYRYLIENKG